MDILLLILCHNTSLVLPILNQNMRAWLLPLKVNILYPFGRTGSWLLLPVIETVGLSSFWTSILLIVLVLLLPWVLVEYLARTMDRVGDAVDLLVLPPQAVVVACLFGLLSLIVLLARS